MAERSKILIVDDEPFNVDYLEQELGDLGYETISLPAQEPFCFVAHALGHTHGAGHQFGQVVKHRALRLHVERSLPGV